MPIYGNTLNFQQASVNVPQFVPLLVFLEFQFLNSNQKVDFSQKSEDSTQIQVRNIPIYGHKTQKSQENTIDYQIILAVFVPPPSLTPFLHQLGYKVVGYIKFTMLLHVFSNVPHHFRTIQGTTKGVHFRPFLEHFSWFL